VITFDELLRRIRSYAPDANVASIEAAYRDSRTGEQGGDPLRTMEEGVQRPLAVAHLLADLSLDVDTLAAGLLYPAVDEGRLAIEQIERRFGGELTALVEGIVRLSEVDYRGSADDQAESFRKMIFAMSRDLRALLVKLADRLYTLRHIGDRPHQVQRRIARETLDIYAPIANRLGIQTLRVPFEDRSFRVLHPEVYARIDRQLARRRAADRRLKDEMVSEIAAIASSQVEQPQVYGRIKHHYSIYRKMVAKRLDLEDLGDIVAFRVVVADVSECYAVLGAIHGRWEPIHERFKDYISRPKPNGYQSLHTTVVGSDDARFEIQIRSAEMHRIAELGIAAHWKYKEGRLALSPKQLEKYSKARQLARMATEIQDAEEFVEMVKVDLFAGEVYVYTPDDDVRWFPRGATALDFAFSIHSEVGLSCIGAKVNGRIVPLSYKLQSGDRVEVLTRKGQTPSRDWMRMVVTPRARNKIRARLHAEARERAREVGEELLGNELRKRGKLLQRMVKRGELDDVLTALKVQDVGELFKRLGYGSLNLERVVEAIVPSEAEDPDELPASERSVELTPVDDGRSPIRVQGLDGMLTTFARCCRPISGEPILGYVTRGRGITIHRADCRQARRLDEERLVEVEWSSTSSTRRARIRILMDDRSGMLGEITRRIGIMKLNITSCEARSEDDGYGTAIIGIEVRNLDHLHKVMDNLERIKGVVSVTRA